MTRQDIEESMLIVVRTIGIPAIFYIIILAYMQNYVDISNEDKETISFFAFIIILLIANIIEGNRTRDKV